MILGVGALGQAVPIGAIAEADTNASFDPYAAVWDDPALDLIYLVELEIFPPQTIVVALAISDTIHAHTADNVTITTFEVDDAAHSHTADNVTLVET